MRCKRHLTDLSNSVGFYSTCLQEHLLVVIAAKTQLDHADVLFEDRPKHDPPSLIFLWSVSPYVDRREYDENGATWIRHQRFYGTPQARPNTRTTAGFYGASVAFKKKHKFSLFPNMFGMRSEKLSSDPCVHNHWESCNEPPFSSSSSSSPSWFSVFFKGRGRKNQQFPKTSRVEHFTQFRHRDRRSCVDQGMSLTVEDECDRSPPESSPEVSPWWKRTPTRASRGRIVARNKSRMAYKK